MNILDEILAHKKEEVRERKKLVSIRALEEREYFSSRRMSLRRALQRTTPAIIAEIKKASPSKGIIRADFDARAIAREYVQNGASALSVLTDEKFFQGSLAFIEQMKPFVPIPILRKDFIIDSYQLYETKAFGADAVLLIAAVLGRSQLHELHDEAEELDLECVVEVHSQPEIASLDFEKIGLVGINNRSLSTFETDISTSTTLRPFIPPNVTVVSESAISSAADIRRLSSQGIDAFLIGEAFMRAESPGRALAELLSALGERAHR